MVSELIDIEGIGPKTLTLLNKLGIYTADDLINYYPYRYEIVRRSDMSEVSDGAKVIVDGVIEGQPTIINISNKLKKIIFRISSKRNIYNITIYNQVYLFNDLKYGKEIIIFGKYNRIKNTIVANEIRFGILPENPEIEPVYYTTAGLSRKSIGKFIQDVLYDELKIDSYLPDYICDKYSFSTKEVAIRQIHHPTDILALKKARQRLKYEELFLYLLKINYYKIKNRNNELAIARKVNKKKIDSFIKNLPYELTTDQITCIDEIYDDLCSKRRMNRLLQGDVGSGKTIVAFIACYINYLAGYQSAVMVPTEILANQHFEDAKKLFGKEMKIEILTSSVSAKKKNEIYKKLKDSEIDLIIGTQSLIQEKIEYGNLGLVITDEQHRFGVNQRSSFINKGVMPDVLSMSATPIPRTFALTIYGDMDISSIKTKPPGRKEVITYFKRDKEITDVLSLMKQELDLKHQIYVIAPAIEQDEEDESNKSVEKLQEQMTKALGKIANIGIVHGRLETDEKNAIMSDFEKGKIDILISTTVIEVGVNVRNASMIVIFNANLFGLSTLHQLRGRVGRSDIQSYCILLSEDNVDRLRMLERCNDGFEISEYDFNNRGEGDLFGIRQSGENGLILANIKRDYKMLLRVKQDVDAFIPELFNENINLFNNRYQNIIDKLEEDEKID